MVTLAHFRRSTLDDPAYQAEQARITALCDGHPTRTWEAVYAVRNAGAGHRGAEVGAYPLYLSRAFKQSYEHWSATDNYAWADRKEIRNHAPTPPEWCATMGHGVVTAYADLRQLPWRTGELDCVVAVSVLEHVDRDQEALSELCRVARLVVVTTDVGPVAAPYEPRTYSRVYSLESLAALITGVTGQEVDTGELPPRGEWLYPDLTVCGFVVEQD